MSQKHLFSFCFAYVMIFINLEWNYKSLVVGYGTVFAFLCNRQ